MGWGQNAGKRWQDPPFDVEAEGLERKSRHCGTHGKPQRRVGPTAPMDRAASTFAHKI